MRPYAASSGTSTRRASRVTITSSASSPEPCATCWRRTPDASSRASPGSRIGARLNCGAARMTPVEPHRQAAPVPGSAAAAVPKRDILGIPVAMTDYAGAIEAMDAMVESRERGYVCAVAVHALTLGYDDPEM